MRNRTAGGRLVPTPLCPEGREIPERKEIGCAAETQGDPRKGEDRATIKLIKKEKGRRRKSQGSETRLEVVRKEEVQGRKDSWACLELPSGLSTGNLPEDSRLDRPSRVTVTCCPLLLLPVSLLPNNIITSLTI